MSSQDQRFVNSQIKEYRPIWTLLLSALSDTVDKETELRLQHLCCQWNQIGKSTQQKIGMSEKILGPLTF